MRDVRSIVLSFARTDDAGDPYAFHMGRQRYLLVSAGGGSQEAELMWDDGLLSDLAAIRRPSCDPGLVQRMGERLRTFLSHASWPEHESRILDAILAKQLVVVTIRSAAAELYALPWELITLKATGQHIGELSDVLLRYEWPDTVTTPAAPLPAGASGRILFAWSAAGGGVPAAEHIDAIAHACQDAGHSFDVQQDVLPHTSLRNLAETLERAQRAGEPIAVLHLLCHGRAISSTFGLALDGEADGGTAVVDAGAMRRALSPYAAMVRLVIIAACDGGNSGDLGNHLGSVAQSLHRIGIANVIASRYPLSTSSAIRLAETLYRELLVGGGSDQGTRQPGMLDEALLALRRHLVRIPGSLDWASLQLYARSADGAFLPASFLGTRDSSPGRAEPGPTPQQPHKSAARYPRWPLFMAAGVAALLGSGLLLRNLRHRPPPLQFLERDGGNSQRADTGASTAVSQPTAPLGVAPSPGSTPVREPTSGPAPQPPEQETTGAPNAGQRKRQERWSVVVRSDDGNVIVVDGIQKKAKVMQRGSQARAEFQLPAGVHLVRCWDSITRRSAEVRILVGSDKNEADCYIP